MFSPKFVSKSKRLINDKRGGEVEDRERGILLVFLRILNGIVRFTWFFKEQMDTPNIKEYLM